MHVTITTTTTTTITTALLLFITYFKVAIHFFLESFAKLQKATISFVTSDRPSVRMEPLGYHYMDVHDILYLSNFRKHAGKIQVSLKSDRNNGTVHEDRYAFLSYLAHFFLD